MDIGSIFLVLLLLFLTAVILLGSNYFIVYYSHVREKKIPCQDFLVNAAILGLSVALWVSMIPIFEILLRIIIAQKLINIF